MKINMGTVDRVVRVVVGVVLAAVGFFGTTGVWSIVLYVLAVVMFVTAAVGFCPLYLPFGISTKKA
jgi:Protein of unknown function (DUF2892)